LTLPRSCCRKQLKEWKGYSGPLRSPLRATQIEHWSSQTHLSWSTWTLDPSEIRIKHAPLVPLQSPFPHEDQGNVRITESNLSRITSSRALPAVHDSNEQAWDRYNTRPNAHFGMIRARHTLLLSIGLGPVRARATNSSDGPSAIWRHAKKNLASNCSNARIGTLGSSG
jgi:hypothetical protein